MSTQGLSMTEGIGSPARVTVKTMLKASFAGVAQSVWNCLAAYLYRRALRRAEIELMHLDDRTLRDIGLTRGEIPAAVRRSEANLLMPLVPE